MPNAASQIQSVPNSANLNLKINVRGELTPTKMSLKDPRKGNFADGIIGATAIERGATLVSKDKALRDAVNKLGGNAILP